MLERGGGVERGHTHPRSKDQGMVGDGAPVRPRVAGGWGGVNSEMEGLEVPGHHGDC